MSHYFLLPSRPVTQFLKNKRAGSVLDNLTAKAVAYFNTGDAAAAINYDCAARLVLYQLIFSAVGAR